MDYTCKYCKRKFKREKTLDTHKCVKRDRYDMRNQLPMRLAFQAYLRFYKINCVHNDTHFNKFINSRYFTDFYKLGEYIASKNVTPDKATSYMEYLFTTDKYDKYKNVNVWRSEATYKVFLAQYQLRRPANVALAETVLCLSDIADQLGCQFGQIYEFNCGLLLHNEIMRGNISPWLIYCESNFNQKIFALPEDLLYKMFELHDPDIWTTHILNYKSDHKLVNEIIDGANL